MIALFLVFATVLLLLFIVLLTVPAAPRCLLSSQTTALGPLDESAALRRGGYCGVAGWDSPGHDIWGTPPALKQDVPLSTCVDYCNHWSGCNGFVWDASNSSCALKQWPSAQAAADGRARVPGTILAMRKVLPSTV